MSDLQPTAVPSTTALATFHSSVGPSAAIIKTVASFESTTRPFAMLFIGASTLAQHRRLGATTTFDTTAAGDKSKAPTGFNL